MPENVTNELIYEVLVRLNTRVARVDERLGGMEKRLASLEEMHGQTLHYLGDLVGKDAGLQRAIDVLAERIDRIEKRLELHE